MATTTRLLACAFALVATPVFAVVPPSAPPSLPTASEPTPESAPVAETAALPAALPAAPAADAAAVTPYSAAEVVADGALLRAAAGTELVFETLAAVSSKTNVRGDRFELRLAEPLLVDGGVLIPVGAPATGEVVHAAKSAMGGQAGELILAVRFVEFAGRQIPLKSFRAGVGQDRTRTSLAVGLTLGLPGMLIRGKHVEMPAGTLVGAKLREDVSLPSLGALPPPESIVPTAATATSAASAASDPNAATTTTTTSGESTE